MTKINHGTEDDNIVIEIRYIDKAISITEQTYCPLCFLKIIVF